MGAWSAVFGALAFLILFAMTVGWFLSDRALERVGHLFGVGGLVAIVLAIVTGVLVVWKVHRPTPMSARYTAEVGRRET